MKIKNIINILYVISDQVNFFLNIMGKFLGHNANNKLNNNRISLFFQEYYMYDNLSLKITFPQYRIIYV